jgi:uncharacterized membrane protein
VLVLALYFVQKNALHYLAPGGTARGGYADRPVWLRLHIVTGMTALFTGLAQFRTGLTGRRRQVHRWVGRTYLGSIALSAVAAVALLVTAHQSWVFESGLAGLVAAWVSTSTLAYVAIRRGNVSQHREWVTRGYVVTFGFVSFRVLFDALGAFHVGTRSQRTDAASWFCWAVPLLITEVVLQGRKVFAAERREVPRRAIVVS